MRTTAEIVADLSETADSFARDDWPATAEQIREAADRLTELDNLLDMAEANLAELVARLAAVNAAQALPTPSPDTQIVEGAVDVAGPGRESPTGRSLDGADVAPSTPAGSDFMADQTTHAESAVGGSPTLSRARDDHAARVMAGVSEPQCWAALFDEIDRLRDDIDRMRDDIFGPLRRSEEGVVRHTGTDAGARGLRLRGDRMTAPAVWPLESLLDHLRGKL